MTVSLLEQLEASVEQERRKQGMTTETRQLETMAGKVTAVNEKGLKLEGRGDAWINFSQPQYRGFFEVPEKGDNVKLGLSPYKDTKFIQTCEIQKRGNGPQSTYDDGMVPAGGKDLSIMRQVCLKAAAEVVSAMVHRGAHDDHDTAVLAIDVLALAQDFESWLIRGDPPFA